MTEASVSCPVTCTCDDTKLTNNCTSANLQLIPITFNPKLRVLHLSDNHIKGIKQALGVYHNLVYVDLSHNQLVSVELDNFKSQRSLEVLLLNGNVISSLQNETFKGLSSLQVLQLNINRLERIESGVFSPLVKLQTLDLSANIISFLSEDAFASLTNLKTLLLRNNKLNTIPSVALNHLPGLLSLDLGINSFQGIPAGSFAALKDLGTLSLDECGIATLEPGSFEGLASLIVLKIQDNDLDRIPTETFSNLDRVEELSIGRNTFVEIPSSAFHRLTHLKKIDISGAKLLESIRKGAFSENSNLETVVIEHNAQLRFLETGVFAGLPNLKRVSLRGNALRYIDHMLLPWDELESLDVRNNPLVCNCSIVWLWTLLNRGNYSGESVVTASPGGQEELGLEENDTNEQVTCFEPAGLKGQLLVDLSYDDLACGFDDSKKQILIGVIIASIIVVIALAMLAFRFRDKVAGVLKTKWNGNRKEPQYQKTNGEEESNILQAAQHPLKNTPVTEL